MESLVLIADYANLTQDGKLNVMGVFRVINATNFPATHPTMYFVAKLGAELGETYEERQLTVKLLGEDGEEVFRFETQFRFPEPEPKGGPRPESNFLLALNQLTFEKPGMYDFVLLVDGQLQGETSLLLNQIDPPSE